MMVDRIHSYFRSLGLENAEAEHLHQRYYKEYGLAIRGLVRHHTIDPLDYDQKCDASLPLQKVLRPDPKVVAMMKRIDKRKTRIFALTNAYKVVSSNVFFMQS